MASGLAKDDSNVDIAVLGKSVLALDEIIAISGEFSSALQKNEIDVKSLHRADPLFRHNATKNAILLYGAPRDFISFKIYAFRDFIESKSLFDLKEKLVEKRLETL